MSLGKNCKNMLRRSLLTAAPALLATAARAEPQEQALFLQTVKLYQRRWLSSFDPMASNELILDRDSELRKALGNESTSFLDWELIFGGINADWRVGGLVILRSDSSDEVYFTFANPGGIERDGALYKSAITLRPGQRVIASGTILRGAERTLLIHTARLDDHFRYPVFLVSYTKLEPAF